jgi:tRNA-specific 2-thiouridylase
MPTPLRRWRLRRGVDVRKDQSYVLYPLTQELLGRSLFPLGGMTKDQVRASARELGLVTADKPESQEICFVADNNYGGFIARYAPDAVRPGPILDCDGRVLGEHRGLVYYTVGQRRGLFLSSPEPRYVVGIDAEANALIVGPERELYRAGLEASGVNWVSIDPPSGSIRATIKIRYRAPEVGATIEPMGGDAVRVAFDEPQKSVTPGQAVVFYDGDLLLGGGTIDRALTQAQLANRVASSSSSRPAAASRAG